MDKKILQKAIEVWGTKAQCEMIIEECIELALSLQKLKRIRGNSAQKEMEVIDEIADVAIMMEQMAIIWGYEQVNQRIKFKIDRLKGRLETTSKPDIKWVMVSEQGDMADVWEAIIDGKTYECFNYQGLWYVNEKGVAGHLVENGVTFFDAIAAAERFLGVKSTNT